MARKFDMAKMTPQTAAEARVVARMLRMAKKKPPTAAEIRKRVQVYRKELRVFCGMLGEYDSAKLIPDTRGAVVLPGLNAEEVAVLEYYVEGISDNLDLLDYLAAEFKEKEDLTVLFYGAVRFFARAAHFIGARTEMTEPQRRFFGKQHNKYTGRMSKVARARLPPGSKAWQLPALAEARRIRSTNPTLTQSDLASRIHANWPPPSVPTAPSAPPSIDWLRKYLSRAEKAGDLPPRL